MFKGCAKWVFVGILVAVFLIIISIFWGNSVASRKAEPNPVTVPVVPNPPKVETAPEPAKTEPVKVPDPPKAEVPETKDPTTAKPGDIVGAVKPEIKDWPTSQTPKADDPVLLFGSEVWKNARRRVAPDGSPSREVLFSVKPGTPVVLPFDVQIEKIGGTNATIFAVGPGGEKKGIAPGLMILTVVPRPEKTDPRRTGAILLYFSAQISGELRMVPAGQPIVTVPESEWTFLDTALDKGTVRLERFNVSVVTSASYPSIYKEAETVPGTVNFFRWYIDWLTGKS